MPGKEEKETGDIFDSTLDLERAHLDQGFQEGFQYGLKSGREEGRQVGLESGFQIGEEIGFYTGCVQIWKRALDVEDSLFPARLQQNILQLESQLQAYPLLLPQNESLHTALDGLRTKFRVITSQLSRVSGVADTSPLKYPGYPGAPSASDTSF